MGCTFSPREVRLQQVVTGDRTMTPSDNPNEPNRRFSVAEYHRLIQLQVFTEDEPVELLEGLIILYDRSSLVEENSLCCCVYQFLEILTGLWVVRSRSGFVLSTSHTEPDILVVRGPHRTYAQRYPGPQDGKLVIEIGDSSLDRDQLDKTRIYARDRIPVYWIVNLVDRRVEVYTNPTGPGDDPRYHTLHVFGPGTDVPIVLDGATVGTIPVNELLPNTETTR
jgi:hypothetical protein